MVAKHDGGDVIVGDEEVWGFETVGVESGEDGGYMIIGGQSIWWIGSGEWRGWLRKMDVYCVCDVVVAEGLEEN